MIDVNQAAIIAKNIKALLAKHHMTQAELASRVGISKSTMSDYMALRSQPSHGVLEKIARVFGVGKSDIDTTYRDSIESTIREAEASYVLDDKKPIFTNLPIVGRISCGNGIVALENIEGYELTPTDWLNGGEYFYLRAKGDSMIGARIYDGDLLLIRKQADIEDGEIAAVYFDGEAVLKRVYKQKNALLLQSENSKYKPIVLSKGQVKIIGKLKKIIINL